MTDDLQKDAENVIWDTDLESNMEIKVDKFKSALQSAFTAGAEAMKIVYHDMTDDDLIYNCPNPPYTKAK